MDLFDVVRACFRRWYILLPVLLITGWYSHQVYASVKPVYYSQAIIGFAPPSFRVDQALPGQPVPRNGLVDIGGAPLLANMAAIGLREPSVVNRVVALGGLPDYSARLFPVPATSPPIPLVMIEQTAPDPEAASKTLALVADEMSPTLQSIQQQAKVPPDLMVDSFVVTPPTEPIPAMPTRTRATASIALAGVGLAVVMAVLADVLLGRRTKRKRANRRGAETEATPTEPVDIDAPTGPDNAPGDDPDSYSDDAPRSGVTDAASGR